MKSILRNCLHSNDIFLIEENDKRGKSKTIIKSSSSIIGINSIKNELNGIEWYNNRGIEKLSITICTETPHYLRTKCLFISGVIYPYYQGFSKNEKHIKSIIAHYCNIWPKAKCKNGLFPIHGDFSMCNVIFGDDNRPIIIDWEHFRKNAAPLGFDALNLIFEQAWIEYEITNSIKNIIEKITLLIKYLNEQNAIDNRLLKFPLINTISFIKGNKEIWGMQINKLPILNFDNNLINIIDKNIFELLN